MGNDDANPAVDHTGEWTSDTLVGSPQGSLYEVACTSEDSGTWDVPFAAVGVYTSLDTRDMSWHEHRDGGKSYTPGTSTVTATFRIREIANTNNFTEFQVICTNIQT